MPNENKRKTEDHFEDCETKRNKKTNGLDHKQPSTSKTVDKHKFSVIIYQLLIFAIVY